MAKSIIINSKQNDRNKDNYYYKIEDSDGHMLAYSVSSISNAFSVSLPSLSSSSFLILHLCVVWMAIMLIYLLSYSNLCCACFFHFRLANFRFIYVYVIPIWEMEMKNTLSWTFSIYYKLKHLCGTTPSLVY